MENIESTIQLLLKKYDEAQQNNEINKMKVYEREIRNLRDIETVMIIAAATNKEKNIRMR